MPAPPMTAAEARQWLLARTALAPRACPAAPADQGLIEQARQAMQAGFELLIKAGMATDPERRDKILAGFASAKAAADKTLSTYVNAAESATSAIPVFGQVVMVLGEIAKAIGTAQSTVAPQAYEQIMRTSATYRGFSLYPYMVRKGILERPFLGNTGWLPSDADGFVALVDRYLAAYGQLFGADLFCAFPRQIDVPGQTLSDWPDQRVLDALSAAQVTRSTDVLTEQGRQNLILFQLDQNPPRRYVLEILPDPDSAEFKRLAGAGGLQAFVSWLKGLFQGDTVASPSTTAPVQAPATTTSAAASTTAPTPPHELTWREAAAQGVHAFTGWLKNRLAGKPAVPGAPAGPAPAAPAAPTAPAPPARPAAAPSPAETAAKAAASGNPKADPTATAITAGIGLAKGILDTIKKYASDDGSKGAGSKASAKGSDGKDDLPEVDDTDTDTTDDGGTVEV